MFGNKVTDFDQSAVGKYGYILKLDITKLQVTDVVAVQAQTNDHNTGEPCQNKTSLTALQMMLSRETNIQIAFCFLDNTCFVFFNSAYYPYANATRFVIAYVRGANTAATDSDFLDIGNRFIGLVKLYALRSAYAVIKGQTPRNIEDEITREESIARKFE